MIKRILLLLAFVLVAARGNAATCSSNTVGSFTCVQSKIVNDAASTTPTISTTSNVSSGNIIVGYWAWVSSTATLSSLTLSGAGCSGATSQLYDNNTHGVVSTATSFAIWNLSSGACTIQANLSISLASIAVIHEISGAINNADPVGTRHNANSDAAPGTGTDAVTSGSATASGTDYIFGATADCNGGNNIAAGTGYTQREQANATCSGTSEDKSASGSNTVTFTDGGNFQYTVTVILSVAASGGGATTSNQPLLMFGAGPG